MSAIAQYLQELAKMYREATDIFHPDEYNKTKGTT